MWFSINKIWVTFETFDKYKYYILSSPDVRSKLEKLFWFKKSLFSNDLINPFYLFYSIYSFEFKPPIFYELQLYFMHMRSSIPSYHLSLLPFYNGGFTNVSSLDLLTLLLNIGNSKITLHFVHNQLTIKQWKINLLSHICTSHLLVWLLFVIHQWPIIYITISFIICVII